MSKVTVITDKGTPGDAAHLDTQIGRLVTTAPLNPFDKDEARLAAIDLCRRAGKRVILWGAVAVFDPEVNDA